MVLTQLLICGNSNQQLLEIINLYHNFLLNILTQWMFLLSL